MAGKSVAMDARLAVAFLNAVEAGGTVSAKCAELGLSRDSYYRYRRRFRERGLEGLLDDSSRPHFSPTATPQPMVDLIVAERDALRRAGWDDGARSIGSRLRRREVPAVPDARTIHRVLVRAGLVDPQPAKRPRASFRRFEHPRPNACWQLDGKQWLLADGRTVCLLRIIDDHSRFILGTRVARSENSADAWTLFSRCATRHGPPAMLLTDNSLAFNARRITGAMGTFEAQVHAVGTHTVSSTAGHPQTLGKKERDWQPLSRWLTARDPATTIEALQRLVDAYDLLFNTDRPHQGLDPDQTPHERYTASPKATPAPTPLPGRATVTRRVVAANGHVNLGGDAVTSIGSAWAAATVTIVRDGHDAVITHDTLVIARIRIDPRHRYQNRSTWKPTLSERS
ncbi:transposase family protein [Phycicoccus sp. HDW14]|uniref:DDE-type integrase/transposase/recombinase n=1 Tax=Phycicoccus sp. HDW14 TaxID=2714941 RepID=UPI00140D51D8|nr:leucine zipper domain-containing protein [Phycicoccus sp. HDW14]QIM22099.1 transposase family protein [Phycicoccus sp. HDW14]QIM22794.1 transposase family protein [Phycicoccus sp. HDW14]